MWGITARGVRLGDGRRTGRLLHAGLARIAVRGPVEHAVLDLSGELDFSAASVAVEVVRGVSHHIVSIDLAGLEFVDTAGARAIEQIRAERTQRHGDRPALIGVSPAVERTLRLVRTRQAQLQTR